MKLSPTEIFKGKKIFFIGGTGFVGKVTLSMLLNNFPDIGKVYATVRARDENESMTRFWTSIVTSPTFDPLREKYGDGFEDFIRSKVVPVNGDVGNEFLGLDEKQAKKIMRDTDIIINGAGNVTFNPPLESALRTNVVGSHNIIKMARMMKKPRLVHVSTCFVAGKRSGPIWENEPVVGYFPRKNELVGTTFDVNQEIADCARLSEQARQEADDAVQIAKFREQARKRFIEEGRDPDDESELKSAIFRERKMWIRERTTELGAERAEYWGWTNIYTYSKSLAEQIIASASARESTGRDWRERETEIRQQERPQPRQPQAPRKRHGWSLSCLLLLFLAQRLARAPRAPCPCRSVSAPRRGLLSAERLQPDAFAKQPHGCRQGPQAARACRRSDAVPGAQRFASNSARCAPGDSEFCQP